MDLLGSILSSMDKRPPVDNQKKNAAKKQQEVLKQQQDKERLKLKQFRQEVEKTLEKFLQDELKQKYEFQGMDKVRRSIIHDASEIAGLSAYSFGEEDEDRHCVVYKKEFAPCGEELNCLRRGEVWDPEKAKADAAQKALEEVKEAIERRKKPAEVQPNSNYLDKYEHLIGKETAKDAARKTEVKKQYGNVPSANKKDQRSIEQTLADIRAKKKLKTSHEETPPS